MQDQGIPSKLYLITMDLLSEKKKEQRLCRTLVKTKICYLHHGFDRHRLLGDLHVHLEDLLVAGLELNGRHDGVVLSACSK